MARPYSVDLREKALQAVASGLSVTEAARLFDVGRSTLSRWRRRQRETGSVTPRASPGRPRRFTLEQEAQLRALVTAHPDLTLAELCAASPVPMSVTTMGRTLHRLGLPRKKRP